MPLLDSAALLAVHYNPLRRELTATFRDNRRTYVYMGVPQAEYDRLIRTQSKGAYFNAHIRDHYPFREVGR